MKKYGSLFFLLFWGNFALFGYDVPEISVGFRLGGEAHFSSASLFNSENATSIDDAISFRGFRGNVTLGFLTDIKTRSWFSITPQVTMAVERTLVNNEAGLRTTWHDINIDVLAKFFVGSWYIGGGAGVSIATPPVYNTQNNFINSNIGTPGDTVSSLGMQLKTSVDFTISFETGYYFALQRDVSYLTVGLRAVAYPFKLEKDRSLLKTDNNDIQMHYMTSLSNKASSLANFALFVGFNYTVN